jgi:hypothetical protein
MNSYTAPNSSSFLTGPFEPKPPVILPAPSYNIYNIHALSAAEANNHALNRLYTPASLSSSPTIPTPSGSPRSPLIYGNNPAYHHCYFEKNNNVALSRKRPLQRVFENDYNQLDILSSITLKSQNYFVSTNSQQLLPPYAHFQSQSKQPSYDQTLTSATAKISPASSPLANIDTKLIGIKFTNSTGGDPGLPANNSRSGSAGSLINDCLGHDPFLCSDWTYSLFKPLARPEIERLLDQTYGGRLTLSRKRKPLVLFNSSINNENLTLGNHNNNNDSSSRSNIKKQKISTQGRPFSSEMVIDLIFPKNLDDLYNMLCAKPTSINNSITNNNDSNTTNNDNNNNHNNNNTFSGTETHRVKLISGPVKAASSSQNSSDGMLTFTDSRAMVKHFTNTSEFSVVTIFRQSSTDKSPFKRGTCPVLKFCISPVYDFSVEYLKSIAYPRYKAGMKFFFIPKIFHSTQSLVRGDINLINNNNSNNYNEFETTSSIGTPQYNQFETLQFYLSAGMYLQDQINRLSNGQEMDLTARIFHNESYPDLPYGIYDKQLSQPSLLPPPLPALAHLPQLHLPVDSKHDVPKANLSYILN